jgi:hypothetical protein
MANFTGAERARCVFLVQKNCICYTSSEKISQEYQKNPSGRPSVYLEHKNFCEAGCSVRHTKKTGRPSMGIETVEHIRMFRSKSMLINEKFVFGTSYCSYKSAASVKKTTAFKAVQIIDNAIHHIFG